MFTLVAPLVLPEFDLGEAINQTVTAISTLGGVVIGGRIAFRFGVRQLRMQRAIERRSESLEKLLDAVEVYLLDLRNLLSVLEGPDRDSVMLREYHEEVVQKAADQGRVVHALVKRAQRYTTTAEQEPLRGIILAQLGAYVATSVLQDDGTQEHRQNGPKYVRSGIVRLEAAEEALIVLLRSEIALPRSFSRTIGKKPSPVHPPPSAPEIRRDDPRGSS